MNIIAANAVNSAETAANTKPDYIAIAIVAALALFVIAMVIRKAILNKRAAAQSFEVKETTETAPVAGSGALAKGTAGKIKLHDVDPKTAAMLMAIVADKTGKPLNELRFISIKEIK